MNGELLMEAMGYLPDEMLEKTDKLRVAKQIPWYRWAALAAGICILLGVGSQLIPGLAQKSNDSVAPENMLADQSTTTAPIVATVETVEEEYLTVLFTDGTKRKVSLTGLAHVPALEPGMEVNIFLDWETAGSTEEDGAENILTPYKITVKEE